MTRDMLMILPLGSSAIACTCPYPPIYDCAPQETQVREWHSSRGHFIRCFRASFYYWCTATAVGYEARAQRGRALRRIRLRSCHKALVCWFSCIEQVCRVTSHPENQGAGKPHEGAGKKMQRGSKGKEGGFA